MAQSRLVLGLAAVFAGLTAVLVIAALAVQPFLLVIALPFAATTYFLWFHATGRLAERAQRRQTAPREGNRSGFADGFRERVGGAAATDRSRGEQATGSRRHRGGGGARYRTAGRRRTRAGGAAAKDERHDLSTAEAYRVLGVSPDADEEAIQTAYREQVKQTHPDTAAGDEESFKRLNRAYERVKTE